MKSFPIIVEYPDNFKEEEVLHSVISNIPLDSYEEIGIRFRTTNVLRAKYDNLVKQLGLMAMSQPSKTKS